MCLSIMADWQHFLYNIIFKSKARTTFILLPSPWLSSPHPDYFHLVILCVYFIVPVFPLSVASWSLVFVLSVPAFLIPSASSFPGYDLSCEFLQLRLCLNPAGLVCPANCFPVYQTSSPLPDPCQIWLLRCLTHRVPNPDFSQLCYLAFSVSVVLLSPHHRSSQLW